MRVRFDELFQVVNGMVSPRKPVQIGGVMMTPGVSFGSGVSFSGIDLAAYIGKDLEVEQTPQAVVIKGIYQ